jgi:acyl-CoA reductase-like NAD-dependent aldehyde dehydrogenase
VIYLTFVLLFILVGLPVTHRCSVEEIFGPVIVVHPFKSEAEAVEIANNTKYGLAGSVWTSNLQK